MSGFVSRLEALKVASDDASFLQRVFSSTAKRLKEKHAKEGDNFKRVIAEEYGDLTLRLDKSRFQESCSVRNVLKTRRLANILINDEGEVDYTILPRLIKFLKQHCYVLGPGRQHDAPRNEHIWKTLTKLHQDKNLQRQLKLITKPFSHKIADQIIRDTLQLPPHHPVSDAHARRAALSALLCYLRQNVGSCFATAPAIIIQNEQPEQFLKDINALFGTGRLQRIFGGVEYSVPLSLSSGAGDLRKMILLDRNDPEAIDDLGYAPGILVALEAIGIIDSKKELRERIEKAKQLIIEAISKLDKGGDYIAISAEEILRLLLMLYNQISEKDLFDYENRPKAMLHTSLIMAHPTAHSTAGGKGEACATFLAQLEVAKSAFKSLADNALLKSWEFTLASFAETKPGFTRWNMYASLGFNADERDGIADCLYQEIKQKLDQSNYRVHELQGEYEQLYHQLKYAEARFRSVASEKEAQWLKIEYESKRAEFRTIEELRDREHFKAGRFANLLNDLLGAYDELFPRYFQEVYDPDMHEVTAGPYDDSPAGFRLLYKHGRANTSQWTLIYTPAAFIEALSAFFVSTETQLINAPEFDGLQQEISGLVTKLVSHVKTDNFLISAFHRMALAHNAPLIKNPLEHLDKIDKKPWAYTSGGTMHNLMSCYFRLEGKPTEQQRWVENELELLVFIIDTIKQMPHNLSSEYLHSADRSLLMHSPTHAFTLKPALTLFKEAILSDIFTYTWARDHLVRIPERFVDYLFLDEEMMQFLVNRIQKFVLRNFRPRFKSVFEHPTGKKNPREFREFLVNEMERDRGLQIAGEIVIDQDQIDSALYTWLPLFSYRELKNRAEKLVESLPGLSTEQHAALSDCFDKIASHWGESPLVTAHQLQDICKAALCLVLETTAVPYDYPYLLSLAAQKLGYAMPTPVLFADSNWAKDLFAFVVSPGSGKLELWRMDYTGSEGAPMSMWKLWLDGTRRDRTWGIFTKPFEYKI